MSILLESELTKSDMSEEELRGILDKHQREIFLNAMNEVGEPYRMRDSKFYRIDCDHLDYTHYPRALVSHTPLMLADEGKNDLPVESYFTLWFAPNIGHSFFVNIDFDINYGNLGEGSLATFSKPQREFDIALRIGDPEKVRFDQFEKIGTEEWLDLRLKYQINGDSYVHLLPNRNRIKFWEGDMPEVSQLAYSLFDKVREIRKP